MKLKGSEKVGDESVEMRKMEDEKRRGQLKIGGISEKNKMERIGDDGMRKIKIEEIEIEKGKILVDGRC